MKRFVVIMQHPLAPEQRAEGKEFGRIIELSDKGMLNVPPDLRIERGWFVGRAAEIASVFGGFGPEDTVMVMGQQQLTMAIMAEARRAGARLVEAVTERVATEEKAEDGSVKKTSIFRHKCFRPVWDY